MYKNMVIYFKYDRFRKSEDRKRPNFNGELSDYWKKQYEDLFKNW